MRLPAARQAAAVWLCGVCLVGLALAGVKPAQADDDLQARYGAALRDAIHAAWLLPDGIAPGAHCRLSIQQLPGGDVVAVDALHDCAFDAIARQSLVRAVYRAAPLPYAGYESVFSRSLTISFTVEGR